MNKALEEGGGISTKFKVAIVFVTVGRFINSIEITIIY